MRCSAHYEVSDSEDIVDVLTDALCGYIGAPRVMRMLRRRRVSSTSCSPKSPVSAALKAATHKRKLSSATRKARDIRFRDAAPIHLLPDMTRWFLISSNSFLLVPPD